MIIEQMNCYFLYNVPITERLMAASADMSLATPPELIDGVKAVHHVEEAPVPAFFTAHYREEHTPYLVRDREGPSESLIPIERLKAHRYFEVLDLESPLIVEWEFEISMSGIGLITICVRVEEPQHSPEAYRLGGLHLDPDFDVVETEPVAYLWQHRPADRPDFVTLDQLACAIHEHFFRGVACFRRYRALRHEIQIPLMSIVVSTDAPSQEAFVEQNQAALAHLVFKPTCWEVECSSQRHVDAIIRPERIWSVAEDALVIVSYEGALFVKIHDFDTGVPCKVSGFQIADEPAVLRTFKVAVSNYHFLRIIDNLLDLEMADIMAHIQGYQRTMNQLFEPTTSGTKREALLDLNLFIVQIINLQFSLTSLLEESRNSDKLIDEEWHIILLDKINSAVGTGVWFNIMDQKIEELRRLAETIERMRENLISLGMNESLVEMNKHLVQTTRENLEMESGLEKLQVIFVALAALQFLQILAEIWFDGFRNVAQVLDRDLLHNTSSRLGETGVSLLLLFVTALSIWGTIWLLDMLKERRRRSGVFRGLSDGTE